MHCIFLKGQPVRGVVNIGQNIQMSDLNSLRSTSCAARVDQGQDRLGIVNRIRTGVALEVQRFLV
jgi:hypothetical protein